MNTLYLFTASYPYNTAETFLEEEIVFLSKSFSKIVIVPLIGSGVPTRTIPANCSAYEPIIKSRMEQYIRGLICFRTIPVFISDFFGKRVYTSFKKIKTWLIAYVLSSNLIKSHVIKSVFSTIDKSDLCYFYWGKGANVLSYFYKGKSLFVSRFHGEWDLWEESSGGYGPIRQHIADSLDGIFFISKKGKEYFQERYRCDNCFYSPLGSFDYGECVITEKKTDILHIVSCSTVYPLKRVNLLYRALRTVHDITIDWTHIGGGQDFEALKQEASANDNKNLQIHLLGEKKHDEVIETYKSKRFDVFINLSTNEGVPVSIMEAESFDIPIIATNVGGTSEVVTSQTGILLSPNPSTDEIIEAIRTIINKKDNYCPRTFWNTNFNSSKNYKSFCELLNRIKEGYGEKE